MRSVPPALAPPAPAGAPAGAETATAAGLAAAQLVANGVAVIFTAVFARVLGTEDYGMLAAALSSFLIFSVPGSALQVATARAVATRTLGGRGELAATLRRWSIRLAVATAALALLGVLLRVPLADVMGIDAYGAAAATLPTVSLWLLLCVQRGALAGLRAFRPVGVSIIAEAAGRLVLGLLLVGAGLGTAGAYLGTPLAMAGTAAVLAVLVARRTAVGAGRGRRRARAHAGVRPRGARPGRRARLHRRAAERRRDHGPPSVRRGRRRVPTPPRRWRPRSSSGPRSASAST